MKSVAEHHKGGPRAGGNRRLLLPVTILLLVSLACSLPGLGPQQPAAVVTEATEQPVVATQAVAPLLPQPTPGPQYLPSLVEVSPLPGSDLTPATAPVFYFNQPMERASVEAAFRAEPALPGVLEWIDDSTLRFIPSQAPEPGAVVALTIGTGAQAANGQPLAEPVAVRFQAPGPLRLAERLPAPGAVDVNPSSAVAATFTRPVAPLGAPSADLPPAFTLDPPAPGRGEWLNTSTYIFYPEPALFGGAQYQVQVNRSLTSVDGVPLEPGAEPDWSFRTAPPALVTMRPASDKPVELDAAFVLTFNQPMDTASVQSDFNLLGPDGALVTGEFRWNEAATEMTFEPTELLQRGANYGLVLFGTASSAGGSTIRADFAANLVTVPQFNVVQTTPAAGESLRSYAGYASIVLTFSSPVAAGQDLKSLIALDPPAVDLNITRSADGYQIFTHGYFQPSASYTLTVDSALRDRWNAALGAPFSFTFSTMPAQPLVDIPALRAEGMAVFAPYGDRGIPAKLTNIASLRLQRGPLTLAEFIRAHGDWEGLKNWESKVDAEWDRFPILEPNTSTPFDIPLTQTGDLLDAGLYFLKINAQPEPQDWSIGSPMIVVVSPIQMTLKVSHRQAFAWVVRIAGREPVAGETVVFYDSAARQIGQCVTGADGACQAEFPPPEDAYQMTYAVTGRPGDANFSLAASNWNSGVSPWNFSVPYHRKGLEPALYLYSDRPIYQPGQTVHFRAVVRDYENGRYALPNLESLTIEISDPYGPMNNSSLLLATIKLALGSYGTASGFYTLPEDARPGTYSVRVQEVPSNGFFFQVAEYRKPEIELDLVFTQPDGLLNEAVQARLDARYFFGAPAGSLPVSWTLYSEVAGMDVPGGLVTGAVETGWLSAESDFPLAGRYLADGKAQTSPDGSLTIEVPAGLLRERLDMANGSPVRLVMEVTAADESGLPISARAAMKFHPTEYYIGVRSELWTAQVGQEITYYVRSVDRQANPVPNLPLTARFSKVNWVQQESAASLAPLGFRMEKVEVGSVDFQTSEQAEARLAFIPAEPGTYLFEATSESGAITQVLTWVGGAGSASWPQLPNQRIALQSDRQDYQPGQTARIFIPNPFDGETQALITVERGNVMRWQVLTIQGSSQELELPLTGEDAPNIYLSVVILGRNGSRPDFRVGYLELRVDPAELLLDVQVDASPTQPQPGGDLTLTIRVRNAGGSPVQGEFSLALVDQAVLSLAGPNSAPIERAFYEPQPLGVMSGFSLARYAGRHLYVPPAAGRGGGGGSEAAIPELRDNFEDTAFWSGSILTDVTGVAQVTLKLPDNLTTWRVDVRGLTSDTLVGQAQAELVTGKPLLIRPVTPRFVVIGDHLELAAVVHNNTAATIQAGVRLDAAGFNLDDPDSAVQPVEIPPGGRFRVTWWGTVQDVPALTPVFRVEGGGLRDAAQPEWGALPVLRYSTRQTFATGGVLSDSGEVKELVSLPRSFDPLGGELRLELSPSLSAAVLDGLKSLDAYPDDFTEPILSRMLPNLAAYQALQAMQQEDNALRQKLESTVAESVGRLALLQNADGGWGWTAGEESDPYLSSYVLFGLERAAQAGIFVPQQVRLNGQDYLTARLFAPDMNIEPWRLDRLAFQYFTLVQSERVPQPLDALYALRDRLSPWGRALLALAIETQSPGDERAVTLVSDLAASASRSATGASWQDDSPAWFNWSTPNFNTALVAYAIARLDPGSQVLQDAVRYLLLHRQPEGGWASSYESAWVLLALTEVMRATGDTESDYTYTASLNGSPLLSGQAAGAGAALNPVSASAAIAGLDPVAPNSLVIGRSAGEGTLYYRAYLEVNRPAQDALPVQRGMSISRQYYRSGQDCRKTECQPVSEITLDDPQPLLVRLTLTVPEDMYYVVVQDFFPAGAEGLNLGLKTSQQYLAPEGDGLPEVEPITRYDLANPFEKGWGWWLFNHPETRTGSIRWVASYLPAGTYELTYRLTPFLAGEFRLLPARAWQYYFPEVEGASAGDILTIR